MSRNTSASRLLTVDLKIDFIARNKGTPEPSKSEREEGKKSKLSEWEGA